MISDLAEFERQFETWKRFWESRKDLDYLNIDSTSKVDFAHNLRVASYRVDLGNKVIFALCKQNCIHTLDVKKQLEEQADKLTELDRLSKVVRSQRADLKAVLQKQEKLEEELQQLRQDYLGRRPLSKKDVEELVLRISEQPKFIEKQTEALTVELSSKVDKIEGLIHKLEKTLTG